MKKYDIFIYEHNSILVKGIEAENGEDAQMIARQMYKDGELKDKEKYLDSIGTAIQDEYDE